jgi:acetyl esterase/lipase
VRWVSSSPTELQKLDTTRISISGTSSGANLAIVAALSASNPETPLPTAQPSLPNTIAHAPVLVLLFIPVVDNTATVEGVWKPNAEIAPWLTPSRMEWYRKLYFTQDDHRSRWDASPNLAPAHLLSKLPRTWIAVAEMDILAPEALAFGEQLKGLGVDVETVVVKGGTHSILTLHGVIDRGYQMIEGAVKHLQMTFGTG